MHFILRSLEYFFDDDGLLTAWADGYDADRYTNELGDAFEVFLAESRKLIIASDIGDLLLPAFEGLVDRGDLFKEFQVSRIFFDFLSFIFVACADLDLFHIIQNIQTGDREVIERVQLCRITDSAGIEPADTARTAGDSTEFMRGISEIVACLIEQLRREEITTCPSGGFT